MGGPVSQPASLASSMGSLSCHVMCMSQHEFATRSKACEAHAEHTARWRPTPCHRLSIPTGLQCDSLAGGMLPNCACTHATRGWHASPLTCSALMPALTSTRIGCLDSTYMGCAGSQVCMLKCGSCERAVTRLGHLSCKSADEVHVRRCLVRHRKRTGARLCHVGAYTHSNASGQEPAIGTIQIGKELATCESIVQRQSRVTGWCKGQRSTRLRGIKDRDR